MVVKFSKLWFNSLKTRIGDKLINFLSALHGKPLQF